MKVAITGGHGFIGNAIVRKLKKRKISYTLLDQKKHNLLRPTSLKSLISGKDVIIHLAAVNRGENQDIIKVNVLGTLSLLEAISEYSPNAKIIFSSTFQVYLKESLYGLSKRLAEELIKHYAQKKLLQGTILRISNVYGPGGRPFYNSVIATFAHLIKNGKTLNINGDGSQKRDFIFVDDVAEAIVKATLYKQQKSVEILDICSGKETILNEVIRIMSKVSRKKFKVVYNNAVKEKPWPTSNKNFRKAKSILGWQPTIKIPTGLKKVMDQK